MEKKPAIICDLDGTLCNVEWRRKLVTGEEKDYDLFNSRCVDDLPNEWCLELLERFRHTHDIIFVSGRDSKFAEKTVNWLNGYINDYTYELYMRPLKDYRPDEVIKKEIYENIIEPKYDVQFVIDDRTKVVKMWRSIGLVCLQCADGDF